MFKVGDVVKYIKHKDYKFNTKQKFIIHSVNECDDEFTLLLFDNKEIMTLGWKIWMEKDYDYYRKEKINKIKKICLKLEMK